MKSAKRCLSFLLALVMLFSLVTVQVFATDGPITGGGTSTGGGVVKGQVVVPGGGKHYDFIDGCNISWNWSGRGTTAVRLRAFPTRGDGVEEYFTYDDQYIYQLDNSELVNAEAYNTTNNWLYFLNGSQQVRSNNGTAFSKWPGHLIIQTFGDGHTEKVDAWKPGSDVWNSFVELCGQNATQFNASNQSLVDCNTLSKLINSEVFENEDKRAQLGMRLGLSEAEASGNFYIVAEQITYEIVYFMKNNKQAWSEEMPGVEIQIGDLIFTPREFLLSITKGTYEAKDPGYNMGVVDLLYDSEKVLCGTPITGQSSSNFSAHIKAAHWEQRVDDAPWKHQGYTMGKVTDGYTLYGFGELEGSFSGGNVAVEYQGDVNTSDPDKFVSTGSLMKVGDSTSLAYYDFVGGQFIDSSDNATLLQFAGEIDMGDEYGICYTSIADYTINTADIELTANFEPAFKRAPGEGYTNSSLQWGTFNVTKSPGVGFTYKVSALDGRTNTSSIVEKFEAAFDAARQATDGTMSRHESSDTTERWKEYNVLDGSFENAEQGMGLSSEEILKKSEYTNKYMLTKDETLGMGYEFIIRGTPVTSRKITFEITADTTYKYKFHVSDGITWLQDYSTVSETECEIDPEAVAWLVVPGNDDSITNSIDSSLGGLSYAFAANIMSAARSGAGGREELTGYSPDTIGLGSTTDEPPTGYTVYEFLLKCEDDGGFEPVEGEVELPAYMLNRYFDNIIQYSSAKRYGAPVKYSLAMDWTRWEWIEATCCHGHTYRPGYTKHYGIEYYDASNGAEFTYDNSKLDSYYPYATGTWSHARRSELTRAWSVSEWTESFTPDTLIVDYGFNLIREHGGDKRAMSGISFQSYAATGDGNNLLRIRDKFGVVPDNPIAQASSKRDSLATLAAVPKEQFNIKSRFQLTGSATGSHPIDIRHTCSQVHGSGDDAWTHYVDVTNYIDQNHTCLGFYGPGGAQNSITYSFSKVIYKYQTDSMAPGWNNLLKAAGADKKSMGDYAKKPETGNVHSDTSYRYAVVHYNGANLKYYPETYMAYKIGGTDMAAINGQDYTKGYVIGETQRTAKSSGLYLFKVNGELDDVPGTVYSDAMQGGSGMLSLGSLVSIPAGADVTVAADPSGITLDLYGYSLDVVQKSDDGKLGAIGSGHAFKEVVKDDEDVYGKWGNSSRAQIDQHFSDWVDKMLDVKNFAADFKLYVDGGLKSENFSATIGRIDRTGVSIQQNGVYQLVIEKGILQTGKGDYNAMIQQIAEDYHITTAKARQMFEDSGLYQTIINAMETCINDVNNSGPANRHEGDDWTNILGGNGNWYDEVSRTFVVRRYECVGNKICDVIASDKIDYQLAPTGSQFSYENASSAAKSLAKWELNIFFDQNAKTLVTDQLLENGTRFYDPQNGSSGFNPSNNAFSVLVDSIYVSNADFNIPASSTQDFYN